MKEYTILGLLSVALALVVDNAAGVHLLRRPLFGAFLVFIFALKLLVNGYLTGARIFLYNPACITGMRLGSIPVEDFLFGFSMVTLSVVFWEYFKRKAKIGI